MEKIPAKGVGGIWYTESVTAIQPTASVSSLVVYHSIVLTFGNSRKFLADSNFLELKA